MSGGVKFALVLLLGGGAGFLLARASERTWGSRVTAQVARAYRASPVRVGDIHTFRAELSLPRGSTGSTDLEVPETVFEKIQAGDLYERRLRAIPFLGLQALDHAVTRNGQPVASWDEGHPVLWGAIGLAGLVVGVLLTALASVLLGLAGIGKAPNV